MSPDREIPPAVREQMVAEVRSDATVREAELARSGHLSVYHLDVKTATGAAEWVLKASPDGEVHGIDTEARLLSLVDDRTSIPVPTVLGAVDDHETLPAPYFLMERAEGTALSKRGIRDLSDSAVERLAKQSGRYLAELHDLDGPDGFGQVAIDPTDTAWAERDAEDLRGRLPVDPTEFAVSPLPGSQTRTDEWRPVLESWVEDTLEGHARTRFSDLTADARTALFDRVASIDGPVDPAFGRIDHGLHNVLLEPESGAITAVIDWAFTLSVPPAYDLVCVGVNLSLEPWSAHPDSPDRRDLVRRCLREGYRERGDADVLERLRRHGPAYELLALVRAMVHLDTVTEMAMPEASEAEVDAVADVYREHLAEYVT